MENENTFLMINSIFEEDFIVKDSIYMIYYNEYNFVNLTNMKF